MGPQSENVDKKQIDTGLLRGHDLQLLQPLTISALTHFCLFLIFLLSPNKSRDNQNNQPVEIVYQNETKRKQIITDPNENELEKSLKKLDKEVTRLSRIARRVEKEVIATQKDKTQNQQPSWQKRAENELKNESQESRDGAPPKPSITGPMPERIAKNARTGDSSIADFVPDVRNGGFTALNSDQFVHYTFYSRINEQVRSRWITNIRRFLAITPQTAINNLAHKTQISQIEIILTPDGKFVKALIHQQSENPDVDQSAIQAFRDATPFHNPPSEMVEADGYIHLHYGFHIHFRPRYIASGAK